MRQIALVYGGGAGLLICLAMFGTYLVFDDSKMLNEVVGSLVMIPGFIVVVFGIKRFCDLSPTEVVRFTEGAIIGFAIVATMSVIYALGWELYLYVTDYSFLEQYISNEIALAEERGVSGLELAMMEEQMRAAAETYNNPFFRFGITIMEIFPLGLIVAFIAVLLLRNPKLFKRSSDTE